MTTETAWIIEDRVRLVMLSGLLTSEDMMLCNDIVYESLKTPHPQVHFVFDLIAVQANLVSVPAIKDVYPLNHSRAGWVILAGKRDFPHYLASFIISALGNRVRNVNTVAEGLDFLVQYDQAIADVCNRRSV